MHSGRLRSLAAAALLIVSAGAAHAYTDPHPDMTGVWSVPFRMHASGVALVGGSTPWLPVSAGDPRRIHIPTLDERAAAEDAVRAEMLRNGGRRPTIHPFSPPPPLTAAGTAAMAHFDVKADDAHDMSCYPYNIFLRLAGGMGSLQIVQNPKALMMATEINGNNFPRIIHLDGGNPDAALPSFEGYSVGHWNGDTLHVETTKIKGDTIRFFDHQFWPLSSDARLIEDYRVLDGGKRLEIMQTLIDPTFYTSEMRRVSYLDWRPDLEVRDFPCEEGRDDQVEMQAKAKP